MKQFMRGLLAAALTTVVAAGAAGVAGYTGTAGAAEWYSGEAESSAGERLGLFQNARKMLGEELQAAGVDTDTLVLQATDKMVHAVEGVTSAESAVVRRCLETSLARGTLLFTKLGRQVREYRTAAAASGFAEPDRAETVKYFVAAGQAAARCIAAGLDGDNDTSEKAAVEFQINLLQAQEVAGIILNNNNLRDLSGRLQKIGSQKALEVERYYRQIATLQTELLHKRFAAERNMILGHFATETGPTRREELTVSYEHALDQLLRNTELLGLVRQESMAVITQAYENRAKVLQEAITGGGQPLHGSEFLRAE